MLGSGVPACMPGQFCTPSRSIGPADFVGTDLTLGTGKFQGDVPLSNARLFAKLLWHALCSFCIYQSQGAKQHTHPCV